MNTKEVSLFVRQIVPENTQYIGQWLGYDLPKVGHCIVDKGVTGCGYTEFCLTNSDNVILCSPRKLLLENKRDQHLSDPNILYLENKLDKEGLVDVNSMRSQLKSHMFTCWAKRLPCKIMVTYDSLKHIMSLFDSDGDLLFKKDDFVYVVDEFQCIFLDAFFKAQVELDFVMILQDVTNVIYLSATPMLKKYTDQMDEFKGLKYFELDWSQTGYVEKLVLQRKHIASITNQIGSIIDQYRKGNFPKKFVNGKWYESREAVFYVNSVTDILRVITKKGLTPADTLIICSDQEKNRKKLKKYKFTIGTVPLKDQPCPMFMFCTKSVYVGVDMYSTSASTYIFADPNIESLALDISIDLPQIAGRQRNKENMFKNDISIFYRITRGSKALTYENFLNNKNSKIKKTNKALELWDIAEGNEDSDLATEVLREKFISDVIVSQYSRDFVSISCITNLPVHNKLIELADERAWEVIQKDYQDSINVTRAIDDVAEKRGSEKSIEYKDTVMVKADEFCENFFKLIDLQHKLKLYCEFRDKLTEEKEDSPEVLEYLNARIANKMFNYYYSAFGTEGCRAKGYNFSKLKSLIAIDLNKDNIKEKILATFFLGKTYTLAEIKEKLGKIYEELGLKKTPKATDLNKYFITKRADVFDKTAGKYINGLRLIDYAKED